MLPVQSLPLLASGAGTTFGEVKGPANARGAFENGPPISLRNGRSRSAIFSSDETFAAPSRPRAADAEPRMLPVQSLAFLTSGAGVTFAAPSRGSFSGFSPGRLPLSRTPSVAIVPPHGRRQ